MMARCRGFLVGPLATTVTVALVLAACETSPRTWVSYKNPDAWSFADGVMRSGPLLVEVRGQPYATESGALAGEVLARMVEAITWSAGARFTTIPAEAASQSLRVILTFNQRQLGGYDQCQGRASGGGPLPAGEVFINATFCSDQEVISNVEGRIAETQGLADPGFASLIRQTTQDLFIRDQPPYRGTGIYIGGGSGGFSIGGGSGGGIGIGIGF
jgi:hypothetical protein